VSNLGKNLRQTRKQLGLTQEEVSQRSGVQAGEVSRIESGKRDPQVSTVERLAKALDVSAADLLK
jgi:transcriptional regulator with XRE-family HTH domain